MFWRRLRREALDTAEIAVQRTDEQIAKIDAQELEVTERLDRLQARKVRNHFASSMYAAMGLNMDGEPR